MVVYINHAVKGLTGRSGSRAFLRQWWSLYAGDNRWTPPSYTLLRRALQLDRNPHLARLKPLFVYVEALPRKEPQRYNDFQQTAFSNSLFELPTAAAVILIDPRRRDRTAYLALAKWINDPVSVRAMFSFLSEYLAGTGVRKLLGPTSLAPAMGGGVLVDHWDQWPPHHTPSNPPYLPELLDRSELESESRLYFLPVSESSETTNERAAVRPLPADRIEETLLPLLMATWDEQPKLLPPDELEATFLLRWLGLPAAQIWLAYMANRPVGFIAVRPDLAGRLRRANGGRNWLWRAWLAMSGHWSVSEGRIVAGGVLPAWRGQGIGRQLLAQALHSARQNNWQHLSAGPFPSDSTAAGFLDHCGATARQRYELRQWSL